MGVLIVAHGGGAAWNDRVLAMSRNIPWEGPVGVAFLMRAAPEQELHAVTGELERRGAEQIIVVPLLVSSFSNHFEEIRYYVGVRNDAPGEVHHSPLKISVPVAMTRAMDDHPLITRILEEQTQKISKSASQESVVLVAHGPNDDAGDAQWLEKLCVHAARLKQALGLKRVQVTTLRDDAPKPVRDAATERLRQMVSAAGQDSRVLVVPVLVSVGGIQGEINKRLEGLDFSMAEFGLVGSPLIQEWVKDQALRARYALSEQTGLPAEPKRAHPHQ